MIEKERLEELIKQCATIYGVEFNKVEIYDLSDEDITISPINFGEHGLRVFNSLGYWNDIEFCNLFETKEEAEWHKEFGCIERTENLKLLPYEEICDGCDYDFVFSTPNHCRVTMFIGGNEIFMYKGISSCWSWELTKENYTLACRKCKELFLGDKDDNT